MIPRFDDHRLTTGVSIAAPGARMILAGVYANKQPDGTWETFTSILPVLALEARLCANFNRRPVRPDNGRRAPTVEGLEREGWAFEGESIEYDVIVHDDAGYGIAPGHQVLEASNGATQLVVCGWPAEEDDDRLAPVLSELAPRAIANAIRSDCPAVAVKVATPDHEAAMVLAGTPEGGA